MSAKAGAAPRGTADLPVMDDATAEAVLRAHIVYLRHRIAQETCSHERSTWATAVDELSAVAPQSWVTVMTTLVDDPARLLVKVLVVAVCVVIGLLLVRWFAFPRASPSAPVSLLRRYLAQTFVEPFRQRCALQAWRRDVQQRVEWLGSQARAQAKADRLTRRFRQRHLRWSFVLLLAAEMVLVGLNLVPDLAHMGLRYALGSLAPYVERVLGSFTGDNTGKGSAYGVVRATEALYIIYYIGPFILSAFFAMLLWATDSARLVLEVQPVQSLVPALREEVARKRHMEQTRAIEALRLELSAMKASVQLGNTQSEPILAIAPDGEAKAAVVKALPAPAKPLNQGCERGEAQDEVETEAAAPLPPDEEEEAAAAGDSARALSVEDEL